MLAKLFTVNTISNRIRRVPKNFLNTSTPKTNRRVYQTFTDFALKNTPPKPHTDYVGRFFNAIHSNINSKDPISILNSLSNSHALRDALSKVDIFVLDDNYVYDQFISWFCQYCTHNPDLLLGYLSDNYPLEAVCKSFIIFCFDEGINLDKTRMLQSFSYHNHLSDLATKEELLNLCPKDHLNMLGFGLDDGVYEKTLASYLIDKGLAKSVNLYGFDPYANQSSDITYLDSTELNNVAPIFDLIIARWVLHHVLSEQRWDDLISCMNKSSQNVNIIFIEHGIVREEVSRQDQKLSDLLNATFDIIANIGLRPSYFTSTLPDLGKNFFIKYLNADDFVSMRKGLPFETSGKFSDVGPCFPNQTIVSMKRF